MTGSHFPRSTPCALLAWSALLAGSCFAQSAARFEEQGGLLVIEAEQFHAQELATVRQWVITRPDSPPAAIPDGDPNHAAAASGNAYIEALPDTRRTHDDKLIRGENFAPQPGAMAVLHYRVQIRTPGRYYVWVRAYSTGPEDNGIHVGLDGEWPESGQRIQLCQGKNSWYWESAQRTEANHCGEPGQIYLDIAAPGPHTISFSMREDGFELDRFLLTRDPSFSRPASAGPPPSPSVVH